MAYINGTRIMSAQLNGLVAIDEELSAASKNPIENKAVGNTLANALKGTATGEGAIRMDSVSPVEHEMDVRVESKNLFDVASNCASDNILDGKVSYEGDIITLTTSSGTLHINTKKYVVYPAGTYTLTVFPMSENVAMDFWTYDAKGGNETFVTGMSEVMNAPKSVTITRDYDFVLCISGNKQNYGTHLFKIQIERGTTATPFTPCITELDGVLVTRSGSDIEPTIHLANMDGTVSGVLSVSATTMLVADTDGVILTATYNKDTNAVINDLVERLAALEATTSI